MMRQYLLHRMFAVVPILLGVSLLVFLMLHLIPGDPAQAMLGEHASPAAIQELRQKLGLNLPLYQQCWKFFVGLAKLDLGRSIQTNNPAFQEVLKRYPATIELSMASMLLATVWGVLFGTLSAAFKNTIVDRALLGLSLFGLSIPIFWLGLLMILIFAAHFHLFPFSGRLFAAYILATPTHFYTLDAILSGNPTLIKDVFGHLILPAMTLSTIPLAMIARTTRASLLEVLNQDFMRTARAKGLSAWQALWKHGLKNALIPLFTVMGVQFGTLLGGAILTETVFDWPGLGRLIVEAVKSRDYPVVQASVLMIALTFVLVNTAVDLAYAWLDPRIKHR